MTKKKSDFSYAFFGTPQFAVFVLDELEQAGMAPDVIVTAPDRPAGRGLELKAPPVKDWALERDIPVIQPESVKNPGSSQELDILQNSDFDLFVVAAYGKIVPKEILAMPRHGVLNVHPSLLPRFRGASPIESQILADEKEVGVSIMKLDEQMDHGPVVAQASITPEPWPLKARILEELLAREGGKLLAESIPPYLAGTVTPEPQDHDKVTFTKKIKKEDGLIQLSNDPYSNYLKFCAYDEWPGTFFFQDATRIKITDAKFEDGKFVPLKVIPEGKREISHADFVRGS